MIFLLAFDSVTHAGHKDSGVQKPCRSIESGYFGRGICAVPADIICRAYCGAIHYHVPDVCLKQAFCEAILGACFCSIVYQSAAGLVDRNFLIGSVSSECVGVGLFAVDSPLFLRSELVHRPACNYLIGIL